MILDLVPETHPLISTKLEKFDFLNPPMNPVELAVNLTETMLAHNGVGLAANQVGLPYRVFVIKASPVLACFNPVIVDQSKDELTLEEGCLTYPGLIVKIKRPQVIRVRYAQPNGEIVTRVYQDLTARIFQHELDHLDGLQFYNRASKFHRDQAFNKAKRKAKL